MILQSSSRKICQGVADCRQIFRLFDERRGYADESFVSEYRGKRTVLVDGLGQAEIKLSEDLTDDEIRAKLSVHFRRLPAKTEA